MKTSSLLPSGFNDLLPPLARRERKMRAAVLDRFARFGYEEVTPPLIEFEENLVDSSADSLSRQTFRMLDAASQKMLGLRADMTPQIARIAASRLPNSPLPLRLCYAGTCVRVKGEGLHQSRQILQAGCELIGSDAPASLHEIITCALEALEKIGIPAADLILDINQPGRVQQLLAPLSAEIRPKVARAIAAKDVTYLQSLAHPQINVILEALTDESPLAELESLKMEGLTLSYDRLEASGYEYYEGIAFSIFSRQLQCEIGRGGRYVAHEGLMAQGFTLFLTPLLNQQKPPKTKAVKRCLIPTEASTEKARELRDKGWQTLHGTAKDNRAEASKLGCTHLLTSKNELIEL